jgi:hypothetical protein
MDQIIELKLPLSQVNYILSVLQQKPYLEVNALIQSIVEQGSEQYVDSDAA